MSHEDDVGILREWRAQCPALQELWPAEDDVRTWEGVTFGDDPEATADHGGQQQQQQQATGHQEQEQEGDQKKLKNAGRIEVRRGGSPNFHSTALHSTLHSHTHHTTR